MDREKLKWDHFDAIEMAKFLGEQVEIVKRMKPKELTEAVVKRIKMNDRIARGLHPTLRASVVDK